MQDAAKRIERSVMKLCQPATLLPSQYVDATGHRRRPEMDLVAAILEDALQCIAHNVNTRTGRRRRDFLDAYRWVWIDRRDWPFAFTNVCDLLGFEPAAVRQFVQRLIESKADHDALRGVHPEDRQADC
jgi:hypothetical protein